MPDNVLAVRKAVPMEKVRADLALQRANGETPMVFYGARTCWWTHERRELYRGAHGLPADSRGGLLFQTEDPEGFLRQAEANAAPYGRHGLEAFLAAHNANSYLALTQRSWCEANWDAYNDAVDRAIAEGQWSSSDSTEGLGTIRRVGGDVLHGPSPETIAEMRLRGMDVEATFRSGAEIDALLEGAAEGRGL